MKKSTLILKHIDSSYNINTEGATRNVITLNIPKGSSHIPEIVLRTSASNDVEN
ncbi:hypothetical protein J6590_005980 [Homalodisca vitripennis]|nr:hypothetical protein J6590_005980 [Homalodisca vitripennis]